jgi:hypothetical protein
MEQKKVCSLCNDAHGSVEGREANTKWRKRGIVPKDRSYQSKSES